MKNANCARTIPKGSKQLAGGLSAANTPGFEAASGLPTLKESQRAALLSPLWGNENVEIFRSGGITALNHRLMAAFPAGKEAGVLEKIQ